MPEALKPDEPDDPLAQDRLAAGKTLPWLVWVDVAMIPGLFCSRHLLVKKH